MASRPDLRVVGGTGDGQPRYYDPGASAVLVETRVFNQHGNRILKDAGGGGDPPGGGGDDMKSLFKLDIPRDVQLAKWGVAVLAGLMATMLWFLLDKIDSRFDKADEKVSAVTERVGDLRVEIAAQRGDIKAVLEKLDGKPQASAGSGNPGTVRQGP